MLVWPPRAHPPPFAPAPPFQAVTRKVRILDVKYNASNNELVRTQTLVKNAIVEVDAAPFKQWYLQHYGVELGKKGAEEKKAAAAGEGEEPAKEVRGSRGGGAGRSGSDPGGSRAGGAAAAAACPCHAASAGRGRPV
jgi:ribosomal protein S8E